MKEVLNKDIDFEKRLEKKFRDFVKAALVIDPLAAGTPLKYGPGDKVLLDGNPPISAKVVKGEAGVYLMKRENNDGTWTPVFSTEDVMHRFN